MELEAGIGLPVESPRASLWSGDLPLTRKYFMAKTGSGQIGKKVRRPQVRLAGGDQIPLFAALPDSAPRQGAESGGVQFERRDPRAIFFAGLRLDEHLKRCGLKAPFLVGRVLGQQDWSAFRMKYRAGGRRPYDPEAMTGLVLMGLMRGDTSLRQLESLARTDLGVMWVTGGICPDHSVIGRFILQHAEVLEGSFLEGLIRSVLQATGTGTDTLAGDGTVIAAQASRLGTLKREALAQAAREAVEAARAAPQDEVAASTAQRLEAAEATLAARSAARQAKGKPAEGLSLHPDEPEAVVQPQKDKRFLPSYKPVVLANKARVVVSAGVHPSSETAELAALLDGAAAQGPTEVLLLDAGFHSDGVLNLAAERDIELLCPEGRIEQDGAWTKQSDKMFLKSAFTYEAERDVYRCPAGALLERRGGWTADGALLYGSMACVACALRERCTSNRNGRQVKRYAGDAAKEAMRAKLESQQMRARYRQRQAMVEPVFSHLKEVQGVRRFRRRGLAKVRLEFALHIAAYNLGRMAALAPHLAEAVAAFDALLRRCAAWLGCIPHRRAVAARNAEPSQPWLGGLPLTAA
jgi:transposase